MAYTSGSTSPLSARETLSLASTASLPLLLLVNGIELVKVVGPTPVLHTTMPYGMREPSDSSTSFSVTCCTLPLMRCTPARMSLLAAYVRRLGSNEPSRSFASTSVMRMPLATSGLNLAMSSRMKLASSPANSTPVGPPPTITTWSSLARSCVSRPGTAARHTFSSSLSLTAMASRASRSGRVFSRTPGMPKVEPAAPVAIASLS
mmetsp:Transcript_20907/g.71244  ORF Transcript_20907/g.71244 Transcript_20907/m.71244 type:complete len:205 (+) Transcript_20907:479-1093(+)